MLYPLLSLILLAFFGFKLTFLSISASHSSTTEAHDHRVHSQSAASPLKCQGQIKQYKSRHTLIREEWARAIRSPLAGRCSAVYDSRLSRRCFDKTDWFIRHTFPSSYQAPVDLRTRENDHILTLTWNQCIDFYRDHKRQTYVERNWQFSASVCPSLSHIHFRIVSM